MVQEREVLHLGFRRLGIRRTSRGIRRMAVALHSCRCTFRYPRLSIKPRHGGTFHFCSLWYTIKHGSDVQQAGTPHSAQTHTRARNVKVGSGVHVIVEI